MTVADDPYCYPNTHVLINRRGYQDPERLEAFEAQSIAHKLVMLSLRPISGPFDEARLRATHRRLFDDVYDWAGQFRTVTGLMYKQRESGGVVVYGDSANVQRELRRVFRVLDDEGSLSKADVDEFAQRAAYFYGELDAIHPFREGNSRTLRQFFADLAVNAGHRFDWAAIAGDEAARARLSEARDVAVMQGDVRRLQSLFEIALGAQSVPSATPRPAGSACEP